jgi:hypothetical protein
VYYRIKNKIINKNNMEKKIFQSGGPIIDEDELFEDGSVAARTSFRRRFRRRVSRRNR